MGGKCRLCTKHGRLTAAPLPARAAPQWYILSPPWTTLPGWLDVRENAGLITPNIDMFPSTEWGGQEDRWQVDCSSGQAGRRSPASEQIRVDTLGCCLVACRMASNWASLRCPFHPFAELSPASVCDSIVHFSWVNIRALCRYGACNHSSLSF